MLPLEDIAVEKYLTNRLRGALLPAQLAATICRRTGGNPLFVVNMANYLVRQDLVVEKPDGWVVQENAVAEIEQGVPDNLRQLIERQIERLNESEQRLLETASVVDVKFAVAAVAAGLAVSLDVVEEQCEKLARKGQFIVEQGVEEWPDGTVSGRYRFLHALYRNVLYERIASGRQVHLHKQIGECREVGFGAQAGEIAAELAMHFACGREVRRALLYLEQAGRKALQRSANAEAIRHFTAALELLKSLPESTERTQQELTSQLALGVPVIATKGYASAEGRTLYERARELCRALGEPLELFPVLWGLWISHSVRAEFLAAREIGDQLLYFAERVGDPDLRFQAHHALWNTLLFSGDVTLARDHIEQGMQLYDPQRHHAQTFRYAGHDPGVCCQNHAAITWWLLGYPEQAGQRSTQASALAAEWPHTHTLTWVLSAAAHFHQLRREPLKVEESAAAGLALAREHDFPMWAAYCAVCHGWAMAEHEEPERGIAEIREGLTLYQSTGAAEWRSYFLALLAEACQRAGHVEEGLAVRLRFAQLCRPLWERPAHVLCS